MDNLIIMRDKILQYNNFTSSYHRIVVYLRSVLDDRMIQQGYLVMAEEELQMCTALIQGIRDKKQNMLLLT